MNSSGFNNFLEKFKCICQLLKHFANCKLQTVNLNPVRYSVPRHLWVLRIVTKVAKVAFKAASV